MRKLALGLLFVSLNSFAVSDCVYFPVMNSAEETYLGKISETSSEMSFYSCPSSILVADRFVGKISQIVDFKNEKRCVYRVSNISIMCRR